MRFDGSYPEKALVETIDAALKRINGSIIKNPNVIAANAAIKKSLSDLKDKILRIETKYFDNISPEFLKSLEEKREKTVALSNQFVTAVNSFKAIFDPLARHVPSNSALRSREEVMGEFLANISAAQDDGESQARVVALLIVNHLPMMANALQSLPMESRFNDDARYACTQNTMREITHHLREIGTPAAVAMWENQTRAFVACTSKLEQLHELSIFVGKLEDAATSAWEEYDNLTIQNKKELGKYHQKKATLREAVLQSLNEIEKQQKSIKLPPNNYGLINVLDIMGSGQIELLDTFQEAESAFRKMMNAADVLEFSSESEADDSDTDTVSSTSSRVSSYASAAFFAPKASSPTTKKRRTEVKFDLDSDSDSESDSDEDDLLLLGISRKTSPDARM